MRITAVYLFSVLILLCLNLEVEAGCKHNGCSVWDIVPYKYFFSPACKKHDVCYACGDDHGWDRLLCDRAFKRDMYKLCRTKKRGLKKWACYAGAVIYYGSVRLFGRKRYDVPSKYWCDYCPKSQGDPFRVIP